VSDTPGSHEKPPEPPVKKALDDHVIKEQEAVSYGPPPPAPAPAAPEIPAPPPEVPWWNKTRPRKLTPQVAADIFSSMEAGTSLKQAALAAGVSERALNDWLRTGRAVVAECERTGKRPTKTQSIYVNFLHAIEEAGARCEDRYVTIIANAATLNWSAAAWMLERKAPARYGQRVQVTVEQELSRALDKLRKKLSPKEYEKVLETLASDQYVEEAVQGSAELPNVQTPALPAAEQTVEVGDESGSVGEPEVEPGGGGADPAGGKPDDGGERGW
jgi:hypothetical protein